MIDYMSKLDGYLKIVIKKQGLVLLTFTAVQIRRNSKEVSANIPILILWKLIKNQANCIWVFLDLQRSSLALLEIFIPLGGL